MVLTELLCPRCGAPSKRSSSELNCEFCGVRLVRADAKAPETEEHHTLSLTVAPSNRDRVARLLHQRLGLSVAEASERVEAGAFDLDLGLDEHLAYELSHELEEAGASAKVIVRQVPIPLMDVILEHPGDKPLGVIVVLRSELELPLPETRALIENTPAVVASALKLEPAQALVDRLVGAGAHARLR